MKTRLLAAALALAFVPAAGASPCARAATPAADHHAAVLVKYSDGATEQFCVSFSAVEDRLGFHGSDLLARTRLHVVFGGTGSAVTVCRIGNDGCPYPKPCFCQCPVASSPSCRFWGYYSLDKHGKWFFQNVGAASRFVHDGDADAWVYGNNSGRAKLASMSSAALCAKAVHVGAPPVAPAGNTGGGHSGTFLAAIVAALFALGIGLTVRAKRRA